MIRQLAMKHFERGRRFELQSRAGEAADAYRQACHLEPDFPQPYFALARIETELGRHDVALELLDVAVTLGGDLEIVEWRAYVRGRLRQYEAALDDYRRVASQGGDPQVLVNQGRMLLALGRFDEARAVLTESGDSSAEPLLDALPRYQEFGGGDRIDGVRAVRYLFGRTLILGTLGDGGLHLSNTRYLLLTPRHIAITIRRLIALIQRRKWQFDGVVGSGPHHGPIAALVADILDLPVLNTPQLGARVLVCSAVIRGVANGREVVGLWKKTGAVMHFALGFVPEGDPSTDEPDLIGFVNRCAVPWHRVESYARLQPSSDEIDPDAEWPGFEIGPAVIDPNGERVLGELKAVWADCGRDPFTDAVLTYYEERHPNARAFEWNSGEGDV